MCLQAWLTPNEDSDPIDAEVGALVTAELMLIVRAYLTEKPKK